MSGKTIAVITMEGFNELDSFIASAMINRVKQPELKALIVKVRPAIAAHLEHAKHLRASLAKK